MNTSIKKLVFPGLIVAHFALRFLFVSDYNSSDEHLSFNKNDAIEIESQIAKYLNEEKLEETFAVLAAETN